MRVAWLLRQLRSATLAMGAASVLAAAAAVRAAFRRREPRPDALFGWLDGPRGDGARARLLYVVSVLALAAQLPFGETGIRLPGLGMLQPIELARIFLVLYLGYWTARAIDGKRERLRGLEGLRERWGYMLHAAPVVVVLALCYGLDDISPILVFSAFLAVFYAATWIRPSLRLWPPSSWGDHLLLELVLVGGVLAAIGWLVLADPDGTVARRVAVWWDPWAGGGDAWQAVTALWATAQGGLFGLGWTGQNGVLPPAVKDDFILALLAARGGSAALVLVAASFGVMLLSAAQALAAAGEDVSPGVAERRSLLAAAALWMLAIQVAVVLGSATGGLPVMGQSLPFVAAAGSQLLLFCLPALAVVLDAQRVAVPLRARPGVAAGPGLEPLSLQPIPITEGGG
jgi:cell division protein FtsW (lipid II flippase)